MSDLLLTQSACQQLVGLAQKDQEVVSETFSRLKQNPKAGLKLWGREDSYLHQISFDLQIVYRVTSGRIEIIGIKKAEGYWPSPEDRISAVILAAGRANYHGIPVQLLPINGVPMISRVTEAFSNSNIDDLIVVLGYQAEKVKSALKGKNIKVIVNPDYEGALSKSLRYGLKMITGNTSAVVLTLGNRPFIGPQVINNLIEVYKKEKPPIIVPVYGERRGHPVIFDASLIHELLKARGNIGGREAISKHKSELIGVEVQEEGVIRGILDIGNLE
jgi:molybdenum cofactor cytidylyltransferase